MDETESIESQTPSAAPRMKWLRRLTVITVVLAALVVAGYVYDATVGLPGVVRFYLSMPSMSRAEFLEIERKAHEGDATSQLYYGVFYANGDGVWQDYAEAAVWYRKAAEQGNARAQRNLAVLYDYGLGVQVNHKEAGRWYLNSARQNDAAAHVGIAGLMFANRVSAFPYTFRWPIIGTENHIFSTRLNSDHRPFGNFETWLYKAHILVGSKITELEDSILFWKRYERQDHFSQNHRKILNAVKVKAMSGDHCSQMGMAILSLGSKVPAGTQIHGSVTNDNYRNGFFYPPTVNANLNYWLNKAAHNGNHHAQFILSQGMYYIKYQTDIILTEFREEQGVFGEPYLNLWGNSHKIDYFSENLGVTREERDEWLRKAGNCIDEPFIIYSFIKRWKYLNPKAGTNIIIPELGKTYHESISFLAENNYLPAKKTYCFELSFQNSSLALRYSYDIIARGDLEGLVNVASWHSRSSVPLDYYDLFRELLSWNNPKIIMNLLPVEGSNKSIAQFPKLPQGYNSILRRQDNDAIFLLFAGYLTWDGVGTVSEESTKFFLKSAQKNNAQAKYQLGVSIWNNGFSVSDDNLLRYTPDNVIDIFAIKNDMFYEYTNTSNLALRWIWSSAEDGYTPATLFLTYHYVNPYYGYAFAKSVPMEAWISKFIEDDTVCEHDYELARDTFMFIILFNNKEKE